MEPLCRAECSWFTPSLGWQSPATPQHSPVGQDCPPPSPVLCLEVALHEALPTGLPGGRWGPAGIDDPVLASLWGHETSERGAEVTPHH